MKKFLIAAIALAALAANAVAADVAAAIPWKAPRYSLVARSMNIREALETFGTAQGISVVMS